MLMPLRAVHQLRESISFIDDSNIGYSIRSIDVFGVGRGKLDVAVPLPSLASIAFFES